MRITKVYTRTGDDGGTSLGGGQKVQKDAVRIGAYGTVDELNSVLGVIVASQPGDNLVAALSRIQNELFHLGSDLCMLEADKLKYKIPQIEKRHVDALESEIDRLQVDLGPLEEFILPGGTLAAAHFHVARTVCRRAERHVVTLAREEPIGKFVIPYLNRLSDLLFVMARADNRANGESDVLWDKNV
mgnify:CR=1 FL=1